MDARWKQRRVYGADHDDPDPGPQPGHEYVELVGGPLDGLFLDVTGIAPAERPGRCRADHGDRGAPSRRPRLVPASHQ